MDILHNNVKQIYRSVRFRRGMNAGLPTAIGFEMTTKCNSLCPMCVRRDYPNIINEDMDFSLLEKTVDEIKTWPSKKILFNLTGLSEPTLYPKLIASIAYIKRNIPESKLRIITNGIALTSDLSKDLIRAGLDECIISLNGTNRDDYIAICGVDAYDKVIENIMAFLENRRRLKATTLRINLNLKKHEGNKSNIPKAVSYWNSLLRNKDVASVSDILPLRGRQISRTDRNSSMRYPCAHLWGETKLDIHGNIYPCDGKVMDFNYRKKSELFLGNIRDISIKDAYLSGRVRRFRKIHIMGLFDSLPTCLSCPSWSRFPNYWLHNRLLPFLKIKWL